MSIRWRAISNAGTFLGNLTFIVIIMCILPNSQNKYFLEYFTERFLIDNFKLIFFCFMFKSIYLSVFVYMLHVVAINMNNLSSSITIIINSTIKMKLLLTIFIIFTLLYNLLKFNLYFILYYIL